MTNSPGPGTFFVAREMFRGAFQWAALRQIDIDVGNYHAHYETLWCQWAELVDAGRSPIDTPSLKELNISISCCEIISDHNAPPVPACASIIGTWIFMLIESFATKNELRLGMILRYPFGSCAIGSCAQLRSVVYSAYSNARRPIFREVILDMDGDALQDEVPWTVGRAVRVAFRLRRVPLSDSIVLSLPSTRD